MTLELPDRAAQRFENLPCRTPAFDELQWLGLIGLADGPSVIYLDDIQLTR